MVCRVEFDRETPLIWQYGGIWWLPTERNANKVAPHGSSVEIIEANLPNALVIAGWDSPGASRVIDASYGQEAEFTADKPGTFPFECWIFCGMGHGKMKGELIVLPEKK